MSSPLARPPVRRLSNESQRAFTLIELLAVIAIVAILSAITFGVVKGVNERAAIGQARAELASLSQSLEAYKRQYGDYPQTTPAAAAGSSVFLQCLIGKLGPITTVPITNGKSFIEVGNFNLTIDPNTRLPQDPYALAQAATTELLDPWGRAYQYYYNKTYTTKTYVLYSYGPTIGDTPTATTEPTSGKPNAATGIVDYTKASTLDNIYANQN